MAELTLLQFTVALLMSLAGVCLFVWGVLSGLFEDVEAIKYRAYRLEVGPEADEQPVPGEPARPAVISSEVIR